MACPTVFSKVMSRVECSLVSSRTQLSLNSRMSSKRIRVDKENIPLPRSKRAKTASQPPSDRVLRASNALKSKPIPSVKRKGSDLASEPQSKKCKTNYLCSLAGNILLEILSHLKPEDQCMKPLSETCQLLRRFSEPRIYVLSLDFDRIAGAGGYPNLIRSYREIRLLGKEIPDDLPSILRTIGSSRDLASKIRIGSDDSACEMTLRTLLTILSTFPGLQELEMLNVSITSQQDDNIELTSFPALGRLFKLKLYNCIGDTLFSVFRRMINLEEFHIEGIYQDDQDFNILIASQGNLFKLLSNTNVLQLDANSLPQLEILEISDELFSFESRFPEKVFKIAPNVHHIELLGQSAARHLFAPASFLMNSQSLHLRSIHAEMESPEDFSISRIQENYPSLILFKSANFKWCKENSP